MKTKLLLTVMAVMCIFLPASARLITFFPTDLDFGSVAVGDTGWQDVRFRYSGPDSGIVYISISGVRWGRQSSLGSGAILGVYQPTIICGDAHAMLEVISNGVCFYLRDFGERPPDVAELVDLSYIELPDSIGECWQFELGEGDSVESIIGISTERMDEGAGKVIGFDRTSRLHTGWGLIFDGVFRLRHDEVKTVSVWFAPVWENELLDSLQITSTYGNDGVEIQWIGCSGTGFLGVDRTEPNKLESFNLLAPFPNPFNSTTNIAVALPSPSEVRLTIIGLDGREVAVLKEGYSAGGNFNYIWNANDNPAGTYYVRLRSGNQQTVRQILLIR